MNSDPTDMSPDALLSNRAVKIEEFGEHGCWKWRGKPGLALGVFGPADLLYAIARGSCSTRVRTTLVSGVIRTIGKRT